MSEARLQEHRDRVAVSRARAEGERRSKRDSEALIAAGLTMLVTVIALYDLVLLLIGLR